MSEAKAEVKMVQRAAFIALSAALVLNCALFGKHIWVDELAQFALGAADSTREAWRIFIKTAGGLNHGQTGVYYMVNHWLLRLFGASIFWLRLPTYLSGLLLLWGYWHLFEQWKVPFHWRLWSLLAISATPTLAFYFSEGRPYLPLAAAVVGTLGYYVTPLKNRSRPWPRALGWLSIVTGALLHPYFALYWAAIAATTYGLGVFSEKTRISLRGFVRHIGARILAVGSTLFLGISLLTWMSHPAGKFNFNPMEWMPKDVPFFQTVLLAHFQFVAGGGLTTFVFLFLFSGLVVAGASTLRRFWPELLGAQLIGIALPAALTALVTYASYRSNYWIAHRQWIASVALVIAGSTAFAATMAKMLPRRASVAWTIILFGMTGMLGKTGYDGRREYSQKELQDPSAFYALRYIGGELTRKPLDPSPLASVPMPKNGEEFTRLADLNISLGGKVDPRLLKFLD